MQHHSHIDLNNLPQHIAVIMDGNGRWAKSQNKARVFGHQNGVNAVREISEGAAELGVPYLTLYAFSKENWKRPAFEVNTLMKLFVKTIDKELNTLNKNNIKLNAIGDLESLPKETYKALMKGIQATSQNTRMTLTLALNYSSRWEILSAIKKYGDMIKSGESNTEMPSEELFSSLLQTNDMPDPDLLIRTSGERRISNYLLWQLSYAELYFTDVLWPDFKKEHLDEAILTFQNRERRFGLTGEQLINS